MPAHRKHSDELIAQAMAIYREHGPAAASRETGIPEGTISSIAHRNGNATLAIAHTREATLASQARNEQRREHLKSSLIAKAQYAVDRIGDDETPTGCQALATATAILVDKYLLTSGEATSRHETRGDLDRFIVARLKQLEAGKRGQRSIDDGTIIDTDAVDDEADSATG